MIAIVGGGLAGTALAKELWTRKCDFLWFNYGERGASHISSGIINPVSGRKFSLAWRYEELKLVFLPFYCDFLTPIEIEKHFSSYDGQIKAEEIVKGREKYLAILSEDWLLVRDSYQLDVPQFLHHYQNEFENRQMIVNEKFDYTALQHQDGNWLYREYRFDNIIFAEGIGVKENPYFNSIDFRPNRGEVLLIEAPTFNLKRVKKQGKFICHYGDKYWVGSTFDNVDYFAALTTDKFKTEAEQIIPQLIDNAPFSIHTHCGALRSTTYNRRPIIGEHPQHKGLYVFNGFGTKGASLIPYCAVELMDNLLNRRLLDSEISIDRIYPR